MKRTVKEAIAYNQGLINSSLEYREAMLYCKFGAVLGIIRCAEIAESGEIRTPIKCKS